MNKIEILENKKLVLKNVIKYSLNSLSIDKIDNEVQKFKTKLLAHNPKIFGPLVICNKGTHVIENGMILVDVDIMVQAEEYKKMSEIFQLEEKHECNHCLVARYNGPVEYSQLAYNKLDIHVFENELVETGIIYTLYKQSNESQANIDIFKQVETL